MELYDRVNAFGRTHQMAYQVMAPGHVVYTFTPGHQYDATPGMTHGGMIAAMMDALLSVAGLSAVHHENKLVATVEFKINYTAPAKTGSLLTGTGKVLQKGKSILVVEGKIVDEKGLLIATALGTLKTYPYQPPA